MWPPVQPVGMLLLVMFLQTTDVPSSKYHIKIEVEVWLASIVVFTAPKKMDLNNIQVQIPRVLLVTKADILDKKPAKVPTIHDPFSANL